MLAELVLLLYCQIELSWIYRISTFSFCISPSFSFYPFINDISLDAPVYLENWLFCLFLQELAEFIKEILFYLGNLSIARFIIFLLPQFPDVIIIAIIIRKISNLLIENAANVFKVFIQKNKIFDAKMLANK